MTSKVLLSNFLKKSKQVLQGFIKNQTQKAGVKVTRIPKQTQVVEQVVTRYQSQVTNNKLFNLWQKVLPKYYFNSIASKLGRQAAWRYGRNLPLFSFVGLVMAQNAEAEEEKILDKIHDFVQASDAVRSPLLQKIGQLSLEQFEFGQLIGQGCNAAVYEAYLKTGDSSREAVTNESNKTSNPSQVDQEELTIGEDDTTDTEDDLSDSESDITVLTLSYDGLDVSEKAPLEFHTTVEDDFIDFPDSDSDISILSFPEDDSDEEYACMAPGDFEVSESLISYHAQPERDDNNIGIKQDSSHDLALSMSCGEIVAHFMGKIDEVAEHGGNIEGTADEYNSLDSSFSETGGKFNLAVKMMFNYWAESNADAIMREMEREAIPARLAQSHGQMETWQNGHKVRKKRLPPHPNIVEMWGVFVDPMPHLPDSLLNYPDALPARINPKGVGRNMTLFLVMKKYQNTLGEYLSVFNPSIHERLILLAQLLEAVCHMRRHGIAHRDLKLDNIFLDTRHTPGVPGLVVGDFGCCLADNRHGLQIPYSTEQIDRGGNSALMAPEISTAEPGMFSYLDYRKSDLWATGALAYEFLGADNPFYSNTNKGRLDSRTYIEEELPPLPTNVPGVVQQLVSSLLSRKASKRPTDRFAADVMHIYLWTPSDWLSPSNQLSKSEVNWWLISMATEVLLGTKSAERDLKRNFLENINMNRLVDVFNFHGVKVC